MARYLVLDWDHQQLQLAAATVKQRRVRLEQAAAWEVPHSPNPAEAEQLGQLLRERLRSAGIAPAPVVVCIGRERVILKDIRHPPVPAAEEPAVVRFQAIKELNSPADEVVIDYVSRQAGAERKALAVVLRRELLGAYQNICRSAGLKLAGICPRPFGAAWAARQAGAQDTVAVLTAADRWIEFCVVKDDVLLLARSLSPSEGGADDLLAEIRRNLAVYAGQAPQEPVRALYIADGTAAGDLRQRLEVKLAIPVHSLDPLGDLAAPAQRRGTFAGGVGLLGALAQNGALPVNFAKPREVRPAAEANPRKIALAAGLVAALVLAGIALAYSQLAAKDRQLNDLVRIKNQLDGELALMKDDERRIKAIGEWTAAEIVWLDELYDLTDRVPDINALRVASVTGIPLTPTANNPHMARMEIKGVTSDDPKYVNTLMDRLVADGYYRVEPKDVTQNSMLGIDRKRYPQQFVVRLDVRPRPPQRYLRLMPPPPRETRRAPPVAALDEWMDMPPLFVRGGLP